MNGIINAEDAQIMHNQLMVIHVLAHLISITILNLTAVCLSHLHVVMIEDGMETDVSVIQVSSNGITNVLDAQVMLNQSMVTAVPAQVVILTTHNQIHAFLHHVVMVHLGMEPDVDVLSIGSTGTTDAEHAQLTLKLMLIKILVSVIIDGNLMVLITDV